LLVRELDNPIASGKVILRKLKSKYQTLDAYIVIGSQYGQTEPVADAIRLFEHIPSAFVNSIERKEALVLFDVYQELNRRNRDLKNNFLKGLIDHCRQRLDSLLANIEIVESTQLQLRFGQLDYDLIRELQTDPLVDQTLTPKSGASIKIVLGTLASLRRKEVISFDVPNEHSTY
jgi:hypothetical protein